MGAPHPPHENNAAGSSSHILTGARVLYSWKKIFFLQRKIFFFCGKKEIFFCRKKRIFFFWMKMFLFCFFFFFWTWVVEIVYYHTNTRWAKLRICKGRAVGTSSY